VLAGSYKKNSMTDEKKIGVILSLHVLKSLWWSQGVSYTSSYVVPCQINSFLRVKENISKFPHSSG
jgi:hypothetical protein